MTPGPYEFNHMAIKEAMGEVEATGDEFELPVRRCDACGEYQRHRELARFDLPLPKSLNRSLFLASAGWQEVSLLQFEQIIKCFDLEPDDPAKIVPGMKVGYPVLHLTTPAQDFVSDGLVTLISERALECIRGRSIELRVTEIDVLGKAGERHRYYNIITPILTLASEEWMTLERFQCVKCREWWNKPGIGRAKSVRPSKAQLIRGRWPVNQGVVYSADICCVYYSPEFVEACEAAKLTGCGFNRVFWI